MSPTVQATATPGSLGAARAAEKCQAALKKGGGTFARKKLKLLEGCRKGLFKCVETESAGSDQDECVAKAGTKCTAALTEKIAKAEQQLIGRVAKKCGGLDVQNGLRSVTLGLGYATLEAACQENFASSGLAGVVDCLLEQHTCAVEQIFDVQAPRMRELLVRANVPANVLADLRCLVARGGMGGQGGGDEDAGKALVKCASGVAKAGARFAGKKQKSLEKCVDALFRCEQTKRGDARCAPKAGRTCVKEFTKIAAAEVKLGGAVVNACPGASLYTALRSALGANVAALDAECARFGVTDLPIDVGRYAACLVRQHECRVEELITYEAPRAASLIEAVDFVALGLNPPPEFPHDYCPTPASTPTPTL